MKSKWYLQTWIICLMFALWPFFIPPIIGIILLYLQHKERSAQVVFYGNLDALDAKIELKQEEIRQLEDKMAALEAEQKKRAAKTPQTAGVGDANSVPDKGAVATPDKNHSGISASWVPAIKPFFTKVAGVTFPNTDGTSRQELLQQCTVGEKLTLVHEPIPQDQNAVKVCRQTGEQLGYLKRPVAAEIGPLLAQGGYAEAEITDLTGGGARTRGCNIKVTAYHMRGQQLQSTGHIKMILS